MNARKRNYFFILVLAFTLLLAACSDDGGKEKENGDAKPDGNKDSGGTTEQTLNLSGTADFTSLDIHHASDAPSFDALYQIGAGFMTFDKDGNFIPDLASEEPTTNDDLTVYTFTIRDDAKWSNDEPVTADDFVYSWKRAVNPDTASEYSFIFESASILNAANILNPDSDLHGKVDELGIKALDEKTVEVTLEKPTPYFVSLMTFPPFYPLNEAFVEKAGDQYATNVEQLLFNGPFKLAEWKMGDGWTFEKNETYWNAEDVKLDTVQYKLVQDAATRVNLYKTGQLDLAEVNAQFITQFKDSEELITGELMSDMKFMRLNNQHEALANQNIRSAIYNAFDREKMIDSLLKNGAKPARYVVPSEWAFDENGADFRDKYPQINDKTVEEAQELWKKGLEEIGKTEVSIDIMFGESDTNEKIVTYLQAQLEGNLPGLTINLDKQPYGQHLKLEGEQKYDISYWGWLPDFLDPITYLDIWITDGPFNRTGFSSPEYDGMIEKANTLGNDPAARWAVLQDAEKVLFENASLVPIFQNARSYVQKTYVKDLIPRNYGPTYDYRYAYIENK
ncbi:peptide ABC transporter substrate-binding protein [Sporosarcina sp. FSL K6-1522]|uniref:peptide ABC transporter substrate-binding protein n=1 Tax=Sporosarcina sp. FSL K6-1522 TaxID=2921554 RepID=UPI00315A7698